VTHGRVMAMLDADFHSLDPAHRQHYGPVCCFSFQPSLPVSAPDVYQGLFSQSIIARVQNVGAAVPQGLKCPVGRGIQGMKPALNYIMQLNVLQHLKSAKTIFLVCPKHVLCAWSS
jgi:hypothetical protein